MGDVKRYTMDENSLMGGMDMFENDNGEYVLHSDYTALLARHNALVEYEAELLGKLGAMEAEKLKHDALAAARETISECLQDTAFRNGVKAGWNAALIKDDAEAEKQHSLLIADNNDRLATLKAARAEVDRLIADCKGEG